MSRSRALWLAALAYVVGGAFLVLGPIGWSLNRFTVRLHTLWIFDLGLPGNPSPETFGVVLNVLLFVPAGFLLKRLTPLPWWAVAVLCVAASAGIEGVQDTLVGGREASAADVIANGLGGLLGSLLGLLRRTRRDHGDRVAARR
jgi:VanZ family protein